MIFCLTVPWQQQQERKKDIVRWAHLRQSMREQKEASAAASMLGLCKRRRLQRLSRAWLRWRGLLTRGRELELFQQLEGTERKLEEVQQQLAAQEGRWQERLAITKQSFQQQTQALRLKHRRAWNEAFRDLQRVRG